MDDVELCVIMLYIIPCHWESTDRININEMITTNWRFITKLEQTRDSEAIAKEEKKVTR